MTKRHSALDPYSISPTKRTRSDLWPLPSCIYASIWFAYQIEGKSYGVTAGCCNHWDCPRCGITRAKQEYGRIVHGIGELAKVNPVLYFQTITCRGKEMTRQEADAGYLEWTNKLLDAYRLRVKRAGGSWVYVQVTERQKRGHPHSHLLTTFEPGDLAVDWKDDWKEINGVPTNLRKGAYRSDWLHSAIVRSGLGEQYDISIVQTPAAAARYVAKYLFKPTAFTADWPKKWRRVRYSQSFPDLPEQKTDAFVLRTWKDWEQLGRKAVRVSCQDVETFDYAVWKLRESDTIVTRRKLPKESIMHEREMSKGAPASS